MLKKILIGTSGYNYPHWKGIFYPQTLPQKRWLEFYTKNFPAVELNVTFYRLPKEEVFKNWHSKTPPDFSFVVKGSRFITHIKRLNDCEEEVKLFFKRIFYLKEKLSAIIWQLPPSLKKDEETLKKFIKTILKRKKNTNHCFEFRHSSWFDETVYKILSNHNIALCWADSSRYPQSEVNTANFAYLRMHGSRKLYSSSYSNEELKSLKEKIEKNYSSLNCVYVFFNNDYQGYAPENATYLLKLFKNE